jgi:hypothetical protein
MLELHNEFAPECSTDPVKERSIAIAVDVTLDVAGVEAIQKVIHTESDSSLEFFVWKRQRYRSGDLQVEGIEPWKPQRIARSDELARLVKSRIGKSGVNV